MNKTNYHTWYSNDGNTQENDALPSGRFLNPGERVLKTDLICWIDAKRETAAPSRYHHKPCPSSDFIYRPDQPGRVRRFRFLKNGETIKQGDEQNVRPRCWEKVPEEYVGLTVYSQGSPARQFRRRRHVKTS